MKLNNSAKLIEFVKQHPFLYDPTIKDKCSKAHKMQVWEDIARALNYESGAIAKTKWRNIRDSYMKHLKAIGEVQQQNGKMPSRLVKYANWPWADQMQFLQLISTNKRSRFDDDDEDEANKTTETVIKNDEAEQDDDGAYSDENETQNGFKNEDYEIEDIKVERTDTPPISAEFSGATRPMTVQSHDFDAVELLFLSYAKTLKTFSQRRQIETKMQIALAMNQAEIQELADCESNV